MRSRTLARLTPPISLILAALLSVLALLIPSSSQAQDWLEPAFRSSCQTWGNCRYQRLRAYRERQREARKAAGRRQKERNATVAEWERCVDRGRRHCGLRPYAVASSGAGHPQCRPLVTAKGGEANTEQGATNLAKRAWRAAVRSDWGEIYLDLTASRDATIRCWRSSTNESVLGRAAEFVAGAYTKRCEIRARPCLVERVPLRIETDND